MHEQNFDIDAHDKRMIETLSFILKILPDNMTPENVSSLIVTVVNVYGMHGVWDKIAEQSTACISDLAQTGDQIH